MRTLLIVNIVLCLFVLIIVPSLIVGMPDVPGAYLKFLSESTLDDDTKEQMDTYIHKTIEIQHIKTRHKIIFPQYACGVMLLVNIYLLVRFRKSRKGVNYGR